MAEPSDRPAPEGAPADSSRASWAAASPFVGDAGPDFDPEAAEHVATPLEVADIAWQPDRVRTILRGQGLLTHEWIGVGREDWLWRESELAAISEPAANVLNKVPLTRAAAAVSDELAVGAVTMEYAVRSIRERLQVLRARQRAQAAARRQAPASGAPWAGSEPPGGPHRFEGISPQQPTEWEVPE